MRFSISTVAFFAALLSVSARPVEDENPNVGKRCTGTISSLNDVSSAEKCTTININGFTVPAGKTFQLSPTSGATVNLKGNLVFGVKNWEGPLFKLSGTKITFNGGGHYMDGQGSKYWDGKGLNGGVTKPSKLAQFTNTGTVSNLIIKNTPARAISLGNSKASLVLDKITVDNSAGDKNALGHNTDCFDISATGGTTVQNSICKNQDDCLAINRGSDITFKNNQCSGGHGISVGSISSDVTASKITITGNTVKDSTFGFRIKTKKSASGSKVSTVTYSGNTATGISRYGLLIDQSYSSTMGTPGKGVTISGVKFEGTNKISVTDKAVRIGVDCYSSSTCSNFDFSGLTVTGGKSAVMKGIKPSGGSY